MRERLVPGIAGFSYQQLHDPHELDRLYRHFCSGVEGAEPALWREWQGYVAAPDQPRSPLVASDLLIRMARHVSAFLVRLFGIEPEASALVEATHRQDPLFRFKVDFVRRRALPLLKTAGHVPRAAQDDRVVERLAAEHGSPTSDAELAVARAGCELLEQEANLAASSQPHERAALQADVEALKRWCAARVHDPEYRSWVVFRFPESLDYFNLVRVERREPDVPEAMTGPDERLRRRDGFGLTDARMGGREVLSEIHYCVLCHERDKDTCAKGILRPDGAPQVNPLGIPLAGCPLGEKISEMHTLRKQGDAVGALALVMLDNPMCPGTGHRICNDCMKSCIYQKQDPVDIPQIETGVLTDVLSLPWGVEIYGLLTRWNPLNVRRPFALPFNGKKVLVVGLGPAGYTLAHHLVNEGFGVVGVDGLKIEPLPAELVGDGEQAPRPIRDWSQVYRPLDDRVLEGFGGVSEYGITVRWDKNFLTLLHLTLARRPLLRMYGGVRFGGTITAEDAWALGFDHIGLAAGAGKPTIIDIKNNLIRGIRKASDFLMALQLTGAFKRTALASLQVRLPAIVIGGGLTAIDTATELMAYYPIQVEKILKRYEQLVTELGAADVRRMYDAEEVAILDELLAHGHAVRAERTRAQAAGEAPDFISLVRSWGGVAIAYRKRLVDSPAYRLNHEEVIKSLEEGISFIENVVPEEAVPDEHGHIVAMRFTRSSDRDRGGRGRTEDGAAVFAAHKELQLACRTLLVAAGTTPNTTYEREHPGTFAVDRTGKFFEPHVAVPIGEGQFTLRPSDAGFFTSYVGPASARDRDHAAGAGHAEPPRLVSFYGDNHPRYAGNVVKAMASAIGYRDVVRLFEDDLARIDPREQPARDRAWRSVVSRLDDELVPRVERVVRLTPTIVEVIVRAPAAARRFRPGQFYRLQNFETTARPIDGQGDTTRLVMEGVALTGAWVDRDRGLLSLITLELGVSSRLCAFLRPGEPVVVMGPTGAPTEIPSRQNVLLAGGGLGNAVLFSIAKALREHGNNVLYFSGYKRGEDLFKREEIEAATDQIIWSTDTGAAIEPVRPQDCHFRGNIVQAMVAYAQGKLGRPLVALHEVHRIIAIGSDRMMAAVRDARHGVLEPYLQPGHVGIASINSPMQCMMKEVCAQCLQRHVDPATGQETIVFSCFNQDQPMDLVDFTNLAARLRQNTVQEKLVNLWLTMALRRERLALSANGVTT